MRTGSGLALALAVGLLSACQGPTSPSPDNGPAFVGAGGTQQNAASFAPYDPFARYAPMLAACAFRARPQQPCNLIELPVIGQENPDPVVDTIMGRVLATDPWMSARVREVLTALPEQDLWLFRPITAVVVGRDIRPSFYSGYTGAIYLDPADLWVTDQERAVISQAPDFRSAFGLELRFRTPWRYVKDNRYASRGFSGPRTLQEVVYIAADLFYHELAHANDYLRPTRIATLLPYQTIAEATLSPTNPRTVNAELVAQRPLRSTLLYHLAAVRFLGAPQVPADRAYTPDFVGTSFAAEAANDFYNYASVAEDVAMLFEEVMMRRRFAIQRDVAVTNVPSVANPTAADYLVVWGQRGRLGDPAVRERARLVADGVFPEGVLAPFLATVPPPVPMQTGRSWLDNLALDEAGRLSTMSVAERRQAAEAPVLLLPHRY
jgi:hypothetical protein